MVKAATTLLALHWDLDTWRMLHDSRPKANSEFEPSTKTQRSATALEAIRVQVVPDNSAH